MRFRAIYGNRVDTVYGTADEALLIETWRDELGPYDAADIRAAIDACRFAYKDFPPTLFQFSDLCRDANRRRCQGTSRIEYSRRGEAGIDSRILSEIHQITRRDRKREPKDWARRILARAAGGEHVQPIALSSAKEALGMEP